MPSTDPDLTELLLEAHTEGGPRPVDRVVARLYDDLRALAHRALVSNPGTPTLSTTALIHEAYVRLADAEQVTARGRAYFFAAAARAMRQILVDYARRRDRLKRGGGVAPLTLDAALVGEDPTPVDLVDLDRALSELAEVAERAAAVVECRFFGGLSVDETALALDVTDRTVKRDWAFARAWLHQRLGGDSSPRPAGEGVHR